MYISQFISLHGAPKMIVSDWGTQFNCLFLKRLHETLGTKISSSATYHLQTRGHMERTNHIREDMLHACVLSYGEKWEDFLPFDEFSYNIIYQLSLHMAPIKAP
jgi:transposase InsO family protein